MEASSLKVSNNLRLVESFNFSSKSLTIFSNLFSNVFNNDEQFGYNV